MGRFAMVGKITIAGDRPNKPAFSDKLLDNGCVIRDLNLQIKCDKDNFNLQIKSFMNNTKKNSDGSINVNDSTIYSLIKDEEGKYSSIQFKYKDKDKYMNDLAEFKKFKFKNDNEKFEFCNGFDFAEFVHSELTSGKFDNAKFRVDGEIEYSSYKNPKTGIENIYTNYNVEKIYVMSDDTEEKATCTLDMYITNECIDDSELDENASFKIMGYIPQYLSKKKGEIGYYQTLIYPLNIEKDKQEKKFNVLKNLLMDNFEDNELCKIGFKCVLKNRIKEVDFDVDTMISDEERELLEFGIITKSELEAKYGKGQGGRETSIEIESITRTYTGGAIPVELTIEQLMKKADEEKPKQEINVDLDENSDDDLNIFGDDDLLPF